MPAFLARVALASAVAAAMGTVAVACSSFDAEPVLDAPPVVGDAAEGGSSRDTSTPPDAPVDAAPEAMADATPPKFSLQCGTAFCNSQEACCYDRDGTPGSRYACTSTGLECMATGAKKYLCDDTADCAALGLPADNVCCGTLGRYGSNEYYLYGARCTAKSNCVGKDDLVRCNPQVANECGATAPCLDVLKHPAPDGGTPWDVAPPFPACPR